jgi:hypothetical protein
MTASWLSGPPSATIAGSWKASDERSAIERHNRIRSTSLSVIWVLGVHKGLNDSTGNDRQLMAHFPEPSLPRLSKRKV